MNNEKRDIDRDMENEGWERVRERMDPLGDTRPQHPVQTLDQMHLYGRGLDRHEHHTHSFQLYGRQSHPEEHHHGTPETILYGIEEYPDSFHLYGIGADEPK